MVLGAVLGYLDSEGTIQNNMQAGLKRHAAALNCSPLCKKMCHAYLASITAVSTLQIVAGSSRSM